MLNHVMVGTNDLDRAKSFYDAVLAVIGAPEGFRDVAPSGFARLFYSHNGTVFGVSEPIDGRDATIANGATVGFRCSSPEQVKEFHDVAIANGGASIEDPPGLRDINIGKLYLAYVRDPDGNKLCAIHRPPQ